MTRIKTFNVRFPHEQWVFMKRMAIKKECSMNAYLVKLIEREMARHKKAELKKTQSP